ncbi:hypothetical protein AQJ66_35430 [Streptomyces bungoensis]|uniref:Uncharacterized protein n=1 Tax=Streptomyces bungoensis TaxID=285568 RepID=A0A101SL16_9ACTN|nr:hypothetical protein [Streptomyces bungoensis]KUN75847.1 hypothetical protein AQJ66_35430 [Streptomyces bungoensis]
MPGTVLLLAASPLGRGRLVDAAGVLPVLAAVAPAVLSGTETANVVELADPLEPQAVLTRLRAAAAAPGPLTVYLTGQLHLDRRQRLPHLALARTTPATVRYTGLPWHWIREELRLRSAADTALVVDLHADAETWQYLAGRPLDSGRTVSVYGRVAPPRSGRRGLAEPSYMKAVATLLRSGHRPPLGHLHEQALARTTGGGPTHDLVLSGPGGHPGAPPYQASPPGLHTVAPPPPGPSAADPHSGAAPAARAPKARAVAPAGLVVMDARIPPAPPAPPASTAATEARTSSATAAGPAGADSPAAPVEPQSPSVPPARTAEADFRVSPVPIGDDAAVEGSYAALAGPDRPAGVESTTAPVPPGRTVAAGLLASPAPGADATGARPHVSHPAAADPHGDISAAVRDGRHGDADGLAARYEEDAVRAYGAASDEALHWAEVRADLAMFAGDTVRSCEGWLRVAGVRLAAGQPADAPAVEAAVDRAHHQWGRIEDAARARELGPALAELRLLVPGRRQGALENVQRHLRQLQDR